MGESSTEPESRDDAALINAIASGDAVAYAQLHERHVAAARSLAGLVAQPDQAEDVLSAAFVRLHALLSDGGGPEAALRPFLLTEVRRAAGQEVEGAEAPDAELAGSLLHRAFTALPERQRAALWHAVIEQSDPAQTAAILGVTADDVAELAANASEAYVQAYLKLYESGLAREDCREAVGGLGHGADGAPSSLDQFATLPHLRACRECRAAAIELADLGRSLGGWVAPVYLSVKATPGYLAAVRVKADKKPSAGGRAAAPARRRRAGESARGTRAAPRRARETSGRASRAPRPAAPATSPAAEHAAPPSHPAEPAALSPFTVEDAAPPSHPAEPAALSPFTVEDAAPPRPAEYAAPPWDAAEYAAPPWDAAEYAAPPSGAAEHVVSTGAEHVVPPSGAAEHVVTHSFAAEHAAPPSRTAEHSRPTAGRRRAGQPGQVRGPLRNASRQQRVLAAGGLVVAAFAGTGLALTLASSNGPSAQPPQRPAPAAIAQPSPATTTPSSPARRRARPAAKPAPSSTRSPAPRPSASASPTPASTPSPVATPPPVQDPFPHHHHHHPPM
jgi:DNA-directed RNA polymerase specialized sigma24 family protein